MPTIRWLIKEKDVEDAWVLNLKCNEDVRLEEFLKGFKGKSEEMKKKHLEKEMQGIDISEEMKDLLKVYIDVEENLMNKERMFLNELTRYMRCYVEGHDERVKISDKLNALREKLGCKEDERDEEEGEE